MGRGSEDWSWFEGGTRPTTEGSEPSTTRQPAGAAPASGDWQPAPADLQWNQQTVPPGGGSAVSAPTGWITAAAVAAVLALVVSPLGHLRPALSLAGWLVGGFVSVGLLTVFTHRDSVARANPWYVGRSSAKVFRNVVIVLAALAVAANAWYWADWFSRR